MVATLFSFFCKLYSYLAYLLIDMLASIGGSKEDADRVLLIRLDAIGDFILWIDAAQAIAKHYHVQGKRTVLIANSAWAAWAHDLQIFDDVISLDCREFAKNLYYRYHFGRRIRRLGCSIAVHPTYSREFIFGDAIVHMCRARERIGFAGDYLGISPWQKRISDRWYTQLIPSDTAPHMVLFRNAEFVRGLIGNPFCAKVPDLRAIRAIREDSDFSGEVGPGENYYVLFPGAGWDGRRWPLGNFSKVAEILHKETGWRGVVCGSPADANLAKDLCAQTDTPLLNWAGRTNLSQLAAVLSGAQLLISNETSAIHMAAALGVPAVCLLGGGHFGQFMPYEVEVVEERPLPVAVIHKLPCFGCNWRCIYDVPKGQPVPCVEQITIEEVMLVIRNLLNLSPISNDADARDIVREIRQAGQ